MSAATCASPPIDVTDFTSGFKLRTFKPTSQAPLYLKLLFSSDLTSDIGRIAAATMKAEANEYADVDIFFER